MYAKLEFLVRFWELSVRHRNESTSNSALTAPERLELLSLMQLVSGELSAPRKPLVSERIADGAPVQLSALGKMAPASLAEVAAGGLLVTLSALDAPEAGDSVLLAAPGDHGELVVPCRVLWRELGHGRAVVALEVDGIPQAHVDAPFEEAPPSIAAVSERPNLSL